MEALTADAVGYAVLAVGQRLASDADVYVASDAMMTPAEKNHDNNDDSLFH